ncbi:unnamed protein product [Rotaria sp. Silwood1]|nr:unnamed protein product [Rotaria sp. Silwood1]
MAYRTKILPHKFTKQEQELHIISNPFDTTRQYLLQHDDYEAPLTAHTLKPNSKWITVRNNMHKIRSWREVDTSNVDEKFRDCHFYYFHFQDNTIRNFVFYNSPIFGINAHNIYCVLHL